MTEISPEVRKVLARCYAYLLSLPDPDEDETHRIEPEAMLSKDAATPNRKDRDAEIAAAESSA